MVEVPAALRFADSLAERLRSSRAPFDPVLHYVEAEEHDIFDLADSAQGITFNPMATAILACRKSKVQSSVSLQEW